VVQAYESGLEHDRVLPAYQKAVYQALIITTIESEESLKPVLRTGLQ
jgi:hypothetical protein